MRWAGDPGPGLGTALYDDRSAPMSGSGPVERAPPAPEDNRLRTLVWRLHLPIEILSPLAILR